ncbi:hypothetical protein T484DRAFT_1766276 [Baffinella frigidus]|nr:hypothetical protein T484DRAFT_1766276 [Cryptophyta sp. CCMP2293]
MMRKAPVFALSRAACRHFSATPRASAIKNLVVIGGGQMGNGITQISAAAGINVNMVDVSEELLSKAIANLDKSIMKTFKKTSSPPIAEIADYS